MLVNARQRRWSLVAAAAVCAVALSACSSSKSKSSGGSSAAGGSSGGGGGASAEVAAAKAAIAPYLTVPTKINQTEKLTGKPPTNRTWVIITCELPQCQLISDGALAAAKAAGVPTKLLSYKTTDGTTLTTAMKDALAMKPIAVTPVGFAQALWDNLQPKFKAAGVFIVPTAEGDNKPSDVVTTGSASQLDYGKSGELMAKYVIADSNAKAKTLVMDVPAFAVLKAYGDGFKSAIKTCSKCTVKKLDLAPAQLATNGVVPAVVSALQADPTNKYLVATDGAFLTGIESALKAASISGIKIVGGSPNINNLTAVKDGKQTAWTAAAEDQYGWVALDILFRKALGMTIPPGDGGRVEMIATKDNVIPSTSGLSAPKDYVQQYKALWGVS